MNKEFDFTGSWVPFLCIFILSTAMSWPLFEGKIIYLADGPYAFIKAVAMAEAWRHGDFVGRWTPDVIFGNGYPFFNFYSPLFSYMSAFLMLLSVPAFWAFNLCIYFMLLASGITMYLFAREIWGKQGGLLAAVAYLVAPYHILDLYTRGSLAEFTAFVFFPLVLRAIYRLMQKATLSDILIGIASTAALILSHNIAALLFCSFSFIYLIYLFLLDSNRSISKLLASLSIFVAGSLITMYFWLPALLEKKYVQTERLLTGIYDYHRNFLTLSQLLSTSWPKNTENYYMIGIVHLILVLAVLFFCFKIAATIKGSGRQIIFFLTAMIVSIVLTLPVSGPIWQALPLLDYAEFPWRFLMCTIAAMSILAGGFIFLFKEELRSKVMWAACLVLILASVGSWHSFGYQDINYSSAKEYLHASLPMDNMEYLPKTVTQINLNPSAPRLEMLSGGHMSITQADNKYLDALYQIHTDNFGILCYHTYNFPGWRVEVNKAITPIEDNPWGLIMFGVPPGDSQVRVYFTNTPVRQLAENISKIAVFLFILCVLFYCPLNRLLFK